MIYVLFVDFTQTELEINFDQLDYSFTEGVASVPDIKVQFKRTQNPFTLMLYPVSHREAVKRFRVDSFIFDPPQTETEGATAGKIRIPSVPFKTYHKLGVLNNKNT